MKSWSKKLFYTLTLISFLLVMSFGLGTTMSMDGNGAMLGCPFMAERTYICQMGAGEHIARWQETFTVAFSLILLIAVFAVAQKVSVSAHAHGAGIPAWLAERRESFLKAFDPVLAAISSGILNPKVYPSIIS